MISKSSKCFSVSCAPFTICQKGIQPETRSSLSPLLPAAETIGTLPKKSARNKAILMYLKICLKLRIRKFSQERFSRVNDLAFEFEFRLGFFHKAILAHTYLNTY